METRATDVFVGRARELGELERVLDAAQVGRGGTVLVAGEAGIGKTRLAAEVASRARDAGFDVYLGRSIDLVGTELPFQPLVEALRPLGKPWQVDGQTPATQLQVFEETLALLAERAASQPVLLVLEDLHWADTSTLDLVVFLAHNVEDLPMLLLATYRADEPASAPRVRRLADGVRRSGSALALELGPLPRQELAELLAAQVDDPLPAALTDAIAARSEGNPFYAEELLAASEERGVELPQRLRDVLLQRVAGLDETTEGLLRVAAAAGRDVEYSLLCAAADLPEPQVRESLREAVAQGVLAAEPGTESVRFRHALLAEAVYATILPGERQELHARLAGELARGEAATAAELAPHWAAAGRTAEALAASVEAARQAEAVFGLAEAYAHLERALSLWPAAPDAAELAGLDLAGLTTWTAELAGQVDAAARAVELGRRAIELIGENDPHRAALLHVRLAEYLYAIGSNEAGLAAVERAVDLVPAEPPSSERAYALGSLAGGLMMAWRYTESMRISEQALALARDIGAREAEVRALTVVGVDLAHLGHAEEGLAYLRQALQVAEEISDLVGLERVYINSTSTLTVLERNRESAEVGRAGLASMRRHGIISTLLVADLTEALFAIGDWDEAERLSAAALRHTTSSFLDGLLTIRALVEIGRGDFDAAQAHLDAAGATLHEYRVVGLHDAFRADLALWQHRWTDADTAIQDGLVRARQCESLQIPVQLCAQGLRAQAELAALARARRDDDAVCNWLIRAQELVTIARRAAAEASAITPGAESWLALAEAEYSRARGVAQPESWSEAAAAWDRLERPAVAAYCRWREAEALVASGARRTEASAPARKAYAVATVIGATPLARELELLAQRARLDLEPPDAASHDGQDLEELLGLTPREAEVLALVARGYTNREIAAALVISVKTASVHVSHILAKLDVPDRREAAAVAHRVSRPAVQQAR
jgi:DNA-binding CsgD family transcriptional regulator/tetratricopeptide (TPR) repeat protein